MKKMFLAAITALALCSYSYAQDDEDEYEDEEETTEEVKKAPAVEEEEEEEAEEEAAPVEKKKEKKSKKGSDGGAFLGVGVGFDLNSIGDFAYWDIKFRINEQMMASAIFGIGHYGETTTTASAPGVPEVEMDLGDDKTALVIGVEFDYGLPTPLLPTFVGGQFIYASAGETSDAEGNKNSKSFLQFGPLFGVNAEVFKNFIITGKLGLMFNYQMTEASDALGNKVETGRMLFGTAAGIELSWFFM